MGLPPRFRAERTRLLYFFPRVISVDAAVVRRGTSGNPSAWGAFLSCFRRRLATKMASGKSLSNLGSIMRPYVAFRVSTISGLCATWPLSALSAGGRCSRIRRLAAPTPLVEPVLCVCVCWTNTYVPRVLLIVVTMHRHVISCTQNISFVNIRVCHLMTSANEVTAVLRFLSLEANPKWDKQKVTGRGRCVMAKLCPSVGSGEAKW